MVLATSLVGANLGTTAHAADSTNATMPTAATAIADGYSLQTVAFPGDTFTQLLGINTAGIIAGYHGSGQDAQHPNKGFVLNLSTPSHPIFTAENYPNSAQTQVIGINASGWTDGFYVDTAGTTHGFVDVNGGFYTVDVPGTTFNQLLGLNSAGEQAGYYQFGANNTFQAFVHQSNHALQLLPTGNAQATGINDSEAVSGFYLDSAGNSHGFLLPLGSFPPKIINYPNAEATQLLGLNNKGQAVGSYTDSGGATHGLVYNSTTSAFQAVDFPGAGSTIVNGINDLGQIVGFYTPSGQDPANVAIGFVGTPSVPKLATTTTLTSNSSGPVPQGSTITFSGSVSPSAATGTVVLYDTYTDSTGVTHPTTQLASVTLTAGSYTYTNLPFTTGSLTQGKHVITASYQGNASYLGSMSQPYTQIITAHF
jgi:hypothetical protein